LSAIIDRCNACNQFKGWIQHGGTEDGITEELVVAGIPRDHIVLGFPSPEKRKYTAFAVE
jgi:hypothetical protein